MKPILEELWELYQMNHTVLRDDSQKKILHEVVVYDEKLRATLSEEQRGIFEMYHSCVENLNLLCNRDAFTEGVRLASRLLIEALYRD